MSAIDFASLALRAVSFILLFQAIGIALFVLLFAAYAPASVGHLRRAASLVGILAIIATAAHYLFDAARLGGEISAAWDLSLQRITWESSAGTAFAARLTGLALVLAGLGRSRPAAFVGIGLTVASFALTGHTVLHAGRALLAGLLMFHLLVVAFWFGALWPLAVASLREEPASLSRLIGRFSAVALWLVPLIFVAGAAMAAALLPNFEALREPYGEMLLAKAAGFSLALGLGAANRWRIAPAAPASAAGARRFRRTLAAEFVVISLVLATSAAMTSLFSPTSA